MTPEMTQSQTDGDADRKQLSAFLIVDWNDETIRTRQTDPGTSLSPYELSLPVEIEVVVPRTETPTIQKRIEVPAVEVQEARAVEQEGYTDE